MRVPCQGCTAIMFLAPAEAAYRKFCSRACVAQAQRRGAFPLPSGHKTEEGKQRSLQNLRPGTENLERAWERADYHWLICQGCGEEFAARYLGNNKPLYCSHACWHRTAYRERRYTSMRVCEVCGQDFETDKYRPRRTCGRSCGKTLAWRLRKTG